jgi:hypothetical protein
MSITIGKRFTKYIETKFDIHYYLEDLLIMVDLYTVHHLTKRIISMTANSLKWKEFLRLLILINKLLIEGVLEGSQAGDILGKMKLCQEKYD